MHEVPLLGPFILETISAILNQFQLLDNVPSVSQWIRRPLRAEHEEQSD